LDFQVFYSDYFIRVGVVGNFSSFGFSSVGIERWQKPKVLKYAAGVSLCTTDWCMVSLRV
tara:strand:- start:48 stop:227 length:180 start_codon:yes stop_codon:yes gene_type:complete